jgi:hypothetical protein
MRAYIGSEKAYRILGNTFFRQKACQPLAAFVLKHGETEILLIGTKQEAKAAKLPWERAFYRIGEGQDAEATWQKYHEMEKRIKANRETTLKVKAIKYCQAYEKVCKEIEKMKGAGGDGDRTL